MIKIFFVTSESKNSFGVNEVIKFLGKELNRYCLVYKKLSILNLINKKIDILHIHGCWSIKILFYFFLAKLNSIKIIISPHGMIDPYSFTQKVVLKKLAWFIFQKMIFKYSDIIIVNSLLEKKNVFSLTKHQNIKIIPHGIRISEIDVIKKIKLKKEIKFVFFSRIHPGKNLMQLIDIWINNEFFNKFKLTIYGEITDDTYFIKIKNRITNIKNIIYKGPLYKNKITKLSRYDVFLFPSKSENFGLVVLEALSAGLFLIINKNLPWKKLQGKKLASLIKFSEQNLIKSIKDNKKNIFSITRKKIINKFLKKNYDWNKISQIYLNTYKFTKKF